MRTGVYQFLLLLLYSTSTSSDDNHISKRESQVYFNWCTSPHSTIHPEDTSLLVHTSVCSTKLKSFQDTHIVLRVQNYSTFFWSDEDKREFLFSDRVLHYSECLINVFPMNALNNEESINVITYRGNGNKISEHYIGVEYILESVLPCSGGSKVYQQVQTRPILYASFYVRGVDTLLALRHNEDVSDAALNFLRIHSIDISRYGHIVRDLNEGLLTTRQSRQELRYQVATLMRKGLPVRIVLGATVDEANSPQESFGPDWIPFSINQFDLLSESDYIYYFGETGTVDVIVSEHALEHMPVDDALHAFMLCYKYLRSDGGYLRVAVPDSWSYDSDSAQLIENDIKAIHFVQYNAYSIERVLTLAAPFLVVWREYDASCPQRGEECPRKVGGLDPLAGRIRRSSCFMQPHERLSLVADAIKCSHEQPVQPLSQPGCRVRDILAQLEQSIGGIVSYVHADFVQILEQNPCHADTLYFLSLRIVEVTVKKYGANVDENNNIVLESNWDVSLLPEHLYFLQQAEWMLRLSLNIKQQNLEQGNISEISESIIANAKAHVSMLVRSQDRAT